MPFLTITADDLLRLARLDLDDAASRADAQHLLADDQLALELTLDPVALADSRITPLLARNVAKLLAAELLARRAREDGTTGAFQGAGLGLSAVPDQAALLRDEARFYLAPFLVRVRSRLSAPFGEEASPGSQAAQSRAFGAPALGLSARGTRGPGND